MVNTAISDVWWKNAVVYCLDVETFVDSDGDGIGDFRGLTQRVNYLAGLGITCIWLMPFYETPNRDDGYDISDFYNVDPRLGSLGDFVEFIQEATERGIRVICDLVVNHTSTQHPWFQSARSDPESPFRDWCVWSEQPKAKPQKVIFPNVEDGNWAYDDESQMYYLHRFYREQPDLNTRNPEVLAEVHRTMGFWLKLGESGFRVDAVPYLIEQLGAEDERYAHELLENMRTFLQRRSGDAILLGEVNLEPDLTPLYFGEDCDELTMVSNFYANASMYLALVRGSRGPLVDALHKLSTPPRDCQWANFVRNHDEANFSRLTDDEREEVLDALAPDHDTRIYGRGIRRRLPPILDGDQTRMRLLYSLMFTLPGTPMIYYGEEIGMGDDLSLPERLPMRTPMQWSGRPHAGFSTGKPRDLVRPAVHEGPFAPGGAACAGSRRAGVLGPLRRSPLRAPPAGSSVDVAARVRLPVAARRAPRSRHERGLMASPGARAVGRPVGSVGVCPKVTPSSVPHARCARPSAVQRSPTSPPRCRKFCGSDRVGWWGSVSPRSSRVASTC